MRGATASRGSPVVRKQSHSARCFLAQPRVLLNLARGPVTCTAGFFNPIQGFAVAFLAFQDAVRQGPPCQCEVRTEIRRRESGGLGGLVEQVPAHRALFEFVARPELWKDVCTRTHAIGRLSQALVLGGEALGDGEEQVCHILALYCSIRGLQLACTPM